MDEKQRAVHCAAMMYAADRASQALGIEVSVEKPGMAVARMTVRDDMLNGHAACHGGYVFTLADTAFAFACNGYDDVTVAAGASIDFVRAVRAGDALVAEARERRRGRRSGIYDVVVRNQRDEEVALLRGRSMPLGKPLLNDSK